jgi:hypothetical protein
VNIGGSARTIASGFKVGGITPTQVNKIPTALIQFSKQKVEIQLAPNVPTSLVVLGLKSNSAVEIDLVLGKKRIKIDSVKSNKNGAITIPPLTLERSGLAYRVQLKMKGEDPEFTVRS